MKKNMEKPYHKLIVWKEAHQFALDIYRATDAFPKHELYAMTSQIRRAALSVVANLVEGNSRKSSKDSLRFFDISRASLAECEVFLEFARDLSYVDQDLYNKLDSQRGKVSYLLNRFISSSTSK